MILLIILPIIAGLIFGLTCGMTEKDTALGIKCGFAILVAAAIVCFFVTMFINMGACAFYDYKSNEPVTSVSTEILVKENSYSVEENEEYYIFKTKKDDLEVLEKTNCEVLIDTKAKVPYAVYETHTFIKNNIFVFDFLQPGERYLIILPNSDYINEYYEDWRNK